MPILLLLFFISAFALAAPASKEEILSAEGEQQIILLNEYLKQHAQTDARGALALIEQIDPSAERDPHSKTSVELDLWKGVAFKYVGRKQDALEFMNRAVSQSRLRSYLELQGEALKQRAYFYMEQSKFKLALEDAMAAYALVESRKDMNELPVISVLIGDIHNDQALYSISYK
ncbi:hypothetical protein [Pseudoalteromonas piscicida]|uniref:Tetratricopeptide repeat protein n=1 Tax=Pseudoalteromonas piscicida TaxID=43662 RepID=A0A2A5JUB9_PSEO7|nr:hypothetical protein [Pseudoalteromonas piscicida]PCK33074.1 hypothetical protein CEX98_04000 [Pseudoalteromonas piscicida]